MKKRLLSLILALFMLLGLLPAGTVTASAAADVGQWLSEGNRLLMVCGITVTKENAGNILVGSTYGNSGSAQFTFMVQGDTVMPTLILDGLNVDDTTLNQAVKHVGSGLEWKPR